MAAPSARQVFLPPIFDDDGARGEVAGCARRQGDRVELGDVLFAVRCGEVEGEVVAPFAGTLVRLHVEEGDVVAAGALLAELRPPDVFDPLRDRLDAATLVWTPRLVVVAAACGALLAPAVWLLAAIVLVGADGVLRHAARHRRMAAVLPSGAAVARVALAGLGLLIAAVSVTAVVAAVTWQAGESGTGTRAAVRLALHHDGLRVFAFFACAVLFVRLLGIDGRAARLGQAARQLPAVVLPALAAAALALLGMVVLVLPHAAWSPVGTFRAAADVLPGDPPGWGARQQATWVRSSARSVTDCLEENGRGEWSPATSRARPDGSVVVSVRSPRDQSPGDRSLGTLLLTLDNQLAPHPEATVVVDARPGRIRFEAEQASRPRVGLVALAARAETAEGGDRRLEGAEAALTGADVEVALECSASGA